MRLLGPLELFHQGQRIESDADRKALALLCYLAIEKTAFSREDLAELLWGPGKLNNLRQALYKLRQLPASDSWLIDDDLVSVKLETDLEAFEGYLREHKITAALELWQGGVLPGFKVKAEPFMNWLELERSRFAQLYDEARLLHLETLEAEGQNELALEQARQLLEADPLNETLHRCIMRLEHARGKTEAALEQFERLRQLLKEELELEPLEETLELLLEIEQGGAGAGKLAQLSDQKETLPHRAEAFMGREAFVKEAQDALHQNKRLLIQGFGGIGKSALAAQLALGYLEQGKVLWLELGQTDAATLINAILRVFNMQQDVLQLHEPKHLLRDVMAAEAVSLLVLDDVWNAYTLSTLLELIPAQLPVLVTSRQRYPRLKRIQLGRLERAESLALLSHYAANDFTAKHLTTKHLTTKHLTADHLSKQADALCEQLGDHAYALRIAGINLKLTGLEPGALLETIKNAPHDLRSPGELRTEDQGSIAQLLKVSLEALDEAAYEAFLGFGALPRGTATPELLERLLRRPAEYLEGALFSLSHHGLASRNAVAGSDRLSYQLHNLAYSYSKAINNYRFKTLLGAVKDYLASFTYQAQAVELELQTILKVAEQTEAQDLIELMRLLVLEGGYYLSEAHSPVSLRLLERAARKAKPPLGHEFLAEIGNYYLNSLGQNQKALSYFKQAYVLAKESGPRSRQAVYQCLIAVVMLRQNEPDTGQAFEDAYRYLQGAQSKLDRCIVLVNYGYFHAMQGSFVKAQSLFKEALSLSSSLATQSGHEKLESARLQFLALNNLAQCLHETGDFEASIFRRKEALTVARANANGLWMADAFYGLGESYHALLQPEQARTMLNEALERYEALRAEAYAADLQDFMLRHGYFRQSL